MHVTVLIPVYNRERFIEDALDSVVAQDYHDWDIVVVDDGSTDRTVEVVKSRMSDDRITLIEMKHGGCAAANARGLEYARGPVITSLGSDDKLMPDSLSSVVPLFENNPRLGYVWTNFVYSTGDQGVSDFLPHEKTFLEALISGWWRASCQHFFRKEIYSQSEGLDTSIEYAVDFQLAFLIGKTGCDTMHIPKVTYWVRIHSHRISNEHHAEQLEAYLLLRRKFRSENMDLTEQYITELEKQIGEGREQIKELKSNYAEQIKELENGRSEQIKQYENSYALRLARRLPFGAQIRKLLTSNK